MRDFRGFLDVAERLSTADDEPSHRSAISRAYYAIYHEARTVAVTRFPQLRDAAPTHERFWRELKRIAEFADIANTGDQLRRARVLADYRVDAFDGIDTGKEAEASVAAAADILRELDTKRGEATS